MRGMSFSKHSILGVMTAVAVIAGAVASCTFSPGPPGSGGSIPGQPGTQDGSSSNPFGANNGSTGTGGNVGGGGPQASLDGPNCGLTQYGLQNVPPDLLIVQDKSGSMANGEDDKACRAGCVSKWTSMTDAINMVVGQTQATIRWGLKFFPDPQDNACAAMGAPSVMVGPNNGAAIMTAIAGTNPGGRTPTAAGVTSGSAYLAALADPNPKYILLATDGEPNCAPGQDTQTPDPMGAVTAVGNSFKAGIPVFVVGIGTVGASIDTLNALATAGGRPRNDATKYYPAASTADLVSVLSMIGGQIASCTFSLGKAPPDPNNIAVYGDGTKLARDPTHAMGWDYGTGMTSVELFGTTCDAVKAKQIKQIQAVLGCPGQVIP
jgi:hypothetical protein